MEVQRTWATAMNARILGSGNQTIILSHGYGADSSVWDKVVAPLAELYQVLVFDWSFSGVLKDQDLFDPVKYSSYEAFADDLIALLEELNLKSSVFVGHSMSGMIGGVASVKRPDLFGRLILVGASPRYLNSEDYEGGFELHDVEQIFANIESNFNQWATGFASVVVDNNDPPSVETYARSLKNMGVKTALHMAKVVFLSDHRQVLEKVTTQCTIIHTMNDAVVPDFVINFMQNKIKGETTVEIINCDRHFPQLTAHEQFLQVIHKVIGSLPLN